ncbi:hypothetical protein BOX15_Mlig015510g3, partial [Macrostomum lignano]
PPRASSRRPQGDGRLRQIRIDNFLKRQPDTGGGLGVSSGSSRQVRITDMRGVVVVEDLYRYKEVLRAPERWSPGQLLDTLNKLAAKQPSRELLKLTKIGAHVKRLTNHPDAEVARAASAICDSWLAHFIEVQSRQQLDVACDAACTEQRRRTRQLLAAALSCSEDSPAAVGIERQLFFNYRSLVGHNYWQAARRLTAKLRSDASLRAAATAADADYKGLLAALTG